MLREGWNFHNDIALPLEIDARRFFGNQDKPYEKIFEANGMCIDGVEQRRSMRIKRQELVEQICWKIVSKIGNQNGISGRIKRRQHWGSEQYRLRPEITVETINPDNHEDKINWAFEIIREDSIFYKEQNGIFLRMTYRKVLEKIGAYSLFSLQEKNKETDSYHKIPDKVSFVFTNDKYYEFVKNNFDGFISPINVSLVLYDIDSDIIIEEFPLLNLDKKPYTLFFKNSDDEPEDEFDDEVEVDLGIEVF